MHVLEITSIVNRAPLRHALKLAPHSEISTDPSLFTRSTTATWP